MRPKNWLSDDEQDSIAKVHMRSQNAHARFLERNCHVPTRRPWKSGSERYGLNGSGKRLRRSLEGHTAAQISMLASLHEQVLWYGTYINHGALDEQISDRVRYESLHFWNAREEVVLKLRALAELGERIDAKLKAIDAAIKAFDVQQRVIDDAVPARYKLAVTRLSHAIKRALAA